MSEKEDIANLKLMLAENRQGMKTPGRVLVRNNDQGWHMYGQLRMYKSGRTWGVDDPNCGCVFSITRVLDSNYARQTGIIDIY